MASRSNKLSRKRKLKALRHGEDHDYIYVDTFDTINREFDRISEQGRPFDLNVGGDMTPFPPLPPPRDAPE